MLGLPAVSIAAHTKAATATIGSLSLGLADVARSDLPSEEGLVNTGGGSTDGLRPAPPDGRAAGAASVSGVLASAGMDAGVGSSREEREERVLPPPRLKLGTAEVVVEVRGLGASLKVKRMAPSFSTRVSGPERPALPPDGRDKEADADSEPRDAVGAAAAAAATGAGAREAPPPAGLLGGAAAGAAAAVLLPPENMAEIAAPMPDFLVSAGATAAAGLETGTAAAAEDCAATTACAAGLSAAAIFKPLPFKLLSTCAALAGVEGVAVVGGAPSGSSGVLLLSLGSANAMKVGGGEPPAASAAARMVAGVGMPGAGLEAAALEAKVTRDG